MLMNEDPELAAPGVYRLSSSIVNAYFIGFPGEEWVLVDTGMPFSAGQIRQAAENIYGLDARPKSIILTHGHFDHAGSVEELSRAWDVPVYAHPREFPYLTGQSEYPPQDPTVGGLGGQMSRAYTNKPYDVSERLEAFPQDGSLDDLPDWKWLHTPGHTPGHISLFREKDRVLIAGDAIITMDMHNPAGLMGKHNGLWGPPEYFTPDWVAALRSIDKLAGLRPKVLLTGHGQRLAHLGLELDLIQFADKYHPPRHGRYIMEPARFDDQGRPISVPPPVNDPMVQVLAGIGAGLIGLVAAFGAFRLNQNRKNNMKERFDLNRHRVDSARERRVNRPSFSRSRYDRSNPVGFSKARRKQYED